MAEFGDDFSKLVDEYLVSRRMADDYAHRAQIAKETILRLLGPKQTLAVLPDGRQVFRSEIVYPPVFARSAEQLIRPGEVVISLHVLEGRRRKLPEKIARKNGENAC
jgi:hypothetical protein